MVLLMKGQSATGATLAYTRPQAIMVQEGPKRASQQRESCPAAPLARLGTHASRCRQVPILHHRMALLRLSSFGNLVLMRLLHRWRKFKILRGAVQLDTPSGKRELERIAVLLWGKGRRQGATTTQHGEVPRFGGIGDYSGFRRM